MTHFLRKADVEAWRVRYTVRAWAAAEVEVDYKRRSLVLRPGVEHIRALKDGVPAVPLPDDWPVVSPEGRRIGVERGGQRYVTVETVDPYHLVFDDYEDRGPFQ